MQDLPIFKFILFNGVETWELPQAPDGWEESFIEWERSTANFGIIRNYSIPLKWTLDGAFFLRNSFYRKGLQAFTSLTIKKLVPVDLTYVDFYRGTIDYSSLVDNYVTVEANIMDSGMAANIKAYENTLFEIPLDADPEAVDIFFGGIALQEKVILITRAYAGVAGEEFNTIGIDIVSEPETKIKEKPFRACNPNPPPITGTIPNGNGWFFEAPVAQTVRAVGNITLQIIPGGGGTNNWTLSFVVAHPSIVGETVTLLQEFSIVGTASPSILNIPFDVQIPMGFEDRLWLRLGNNLSNLNAVQVTPDTFTLEYFNKAESNFCKGLRADKVFNRLIKKVSGNTAVSQSFLLSSDFPNFYYVSGDSLRDLPGSMLRITLKDFVKDWMAIACAGLGVENEVAVLERRDYFFRKNQKIDSLGAVQNATFEIQQDLIYNTIKVGSKNENVDDINGRFEFNSEVQWQSPITKITQEYEILTASRTDAYGIEFTRIDFENRDTTDNRADNEAFIIDVKKVEGVGFFAAVRADRYTSASGSPSIETVYNLLLSPKQNLLRHNYWLASSFQGIENFFISPVSFLKNDALITTDFGGNTVIENSSIFIQSLGDKLYLPIVATVQAKYARSLFTVINSTPYGFIEFEWLDNTYKGYILSASFNPANYEEKEFKLLLTPDNNLLSLIR